MRKKFKGNYMQAARDLCEWFNERNLSAQESAAIMGVILVKMLPPEAGVEWAEALKFGFWHEEKMREFKNRKRK